MLGFSPLAASPLAALAGSELSPSVMLARVGSYTISGQSVSIVAARKFSPAVGAYTVSGQAMSFSVAISKEAIYRTFLVGSSAPLISGFKMITNFTMTAGDTKVLVVTVKDAEGTPVSITGSTIQWRCAPSFGKAASISKTTSDNIQITDGPSGIFAVTLSPSDTDNLLGNFYHEAEIAFSDATISTVLFGTMKVNPALIAAT
jgi:hypothetical protein